MSAALPPLAKVEQLADWIGEPIPEDSLDGKRAAAVLRLTSSLVRAYTERTWDEGLVPDGVQDVVLQASGRVFTNPEGWGNERLDDWGAGQRPIEEWGVYLTASEKSILDQHRKRKVSGIGAISTYRNPRPDPLAGFVPTPDGPPIHWPGW